ncbi:MAG TPA: ribosome maturation factor RimM [Actinomycetes bacterium]|nr:ribosome maturation factor RimM [Actinomycetes bacterium]
MQVVVGRIGRAHGVRGEVLVDSRTDSPDQRFVAGAVLATEPASSGPLTVTHAREHSGRLVVAFAQAGDRTAAEALRGTLLLAEVDPHEAAGPDEFYDHQLVGLRARTVAGEDVGEVVAVQHGGAQDLLVVRREGADVLVPFVSAIVPAVDLAAGHVLLDPPAGLLDLETAP